MARPAVKDKSQIIVRGNRLLGTLTDIVHEQHYIVMQT